MTGKRCLGYHCPDDYRNNCVWHMQIARASDAVFQSQRVGAECDNFQQFRESWGDGSDRND